MEPGRGRRIACCVRCHLTPLTEQRAADLRRRRAGLRRGGRSLANLDDAELLGHFHGSVFEPPVVERIIIERDVDPVDEVVDVIRCCLLGWRRVASGEFCSWRPIRNGLARVGLDDLELIDEACRRLGVERRRCGQGERWRLAVDGR